MNRIKCPNCGSRNTHQTHAHASNELGYWQQIHCFNCKHLWFARQETQDMILQRQIDVLASVLLRGVSAKNEEEIVVLEDIFDMLVDMQKVSMETKEE